FSFVLSFRLRASGMRDRSCNSTARAPAVQSRGCAALPAAVAAFAAWSPSAAAHRTRPAGWPLPCAFQRYNSCMGLPRRRTFWFSAALLLAVVVGSWLFMPQSRVTQENFDRLRDGMTLEEVVAILGEETEGWKRPDSRTRVFPD